MKLVNEVEEKILDRKTVVYEGEYKSATPARADLQLEIAKLQKADPKLVVVENISTRFGTNEVTITAKVYDNQEAYNKIVPKHLAKKSEVKEPEAPAPAEEPATEEAPVEAAPEEAPATEEKKEE